MPQGYNVDESNGYSLSVGFIYIFNLIVGTGALTMPKAFENSGVILSTILLIFLTLMSFITATFMFESMSIANAIKKFQKKQERGGQSKYSYFNKNVEFQDDQEAQNQVSIENDQIQGESFDENRTKNAYESEINNDDTIINEDRPLINQNADGLSNKHGSINDFGEITQNDGESNLPMSAREINNFFAITNKFEMSEMATLFFNKSGQLLFYFAMGLYLYGDLAIYDAAVPRSLRDTTCTYKNSNQTLIESDPCWSSVPWLSRMNTYRIYVVAFNLLIGPLVFYNAQKTKLLQLITTGMRWTAFLIMISLALKKTFADDSHSGSNIDANLFNIKGVPNFFGVCIYAFMCHHSLPGIITPMKQKDKYKKVFIGAYVCIMIFYLLLSYTGVLAFGKDLNDFYTLNFLPDNKETQNTFMLIIDYYLSLFPVFTISASFPIIGITLRNNLKSLYYFIGSKRERMDFEPAERNLFVSIGLPLITLLPPLAIAFITHDLQLLVGTTGSYAGVAIQYVIPSCLLYFARREAILVFRHNYQDVNIYSSPFKHKYWVFFVLVWSNVSVIFVTVNHILNKN